ncbi:MAG: leucine-rich repeat domain-containing protein [Peptococcaceae bacterium]|nr:leucine-rich repeat domain-containing protein [Peptococcaceae bacterium]
MNNIKKYEPLWGTWYVESLIGEGSFGKVYKVFRQEIADSEFAKHGNPEYSAVKIISIPHDQAEIRQIRNEGLDEESMRNFLRALVDDILGEINMLNKLHDNPHIVSFKDHIVIEKTDTVGWDILIRMELLANLSDYANQRQMTQAEVIKVGIHICRALELCGQNNIIHRDIKADNIFVSQNGVYKLGDFGIARQIERTMSGMSKKGTYTTMAPEVFTGEPYGASVDTYALGMVMYSLLNRNRSPFMPNYPHPIVPDDRDNALNRRMNGEPIPPIMSVGAELNAIILKACAFSREKRYANPAEMRQDLEAVAGMEHYMSESTSGFQIESPVGAVGQPPKQGVDGTFCLMPETTGSAYTEPLSAENDNSPTHDQMPGYDSITARGVNGHMTGFGESGNHDGGGVADIHADTTVPKKKNKKRNLFIACGAASLAVLALAVVFIIAVLPGLGSKDITQIVTGYGISINGQAEFVLSDQDEAKAVLEELKEHYINRLDTVTNKVSFVTYMEDVQIVEITEDSQNVLEKLEVLQKLIRGELQTIKHTVTEDETLQDIAKKYDTLPDSILAENEEIEEALLEDGAVIELVISRPYLNVIVEGECELIEDIEFETETQKNYKLTWDVVEIKQVGEKGSKNVFCTYISRNGVITGKTVHNEVVTKQPVMEIVLEGTQAVYCNLTGQGITNEKLVSMIRSGEIPSNVTNLELFSNDITDLTPLKSLTGLRDLGLRRNKVIDYTPLKSLASLRSLDLSLNNISDLTTLKGLTSLTSLTKLDLYANKITDITPLKSLTNLTELVLIDNNVSDITPLKHLTKLEVLTLASNNISDISPLRLLTSLEDLNLDSNKISDIEPLKTLTGLKKLWLSNNNISEILRLQALIYLRELDLYGNNITDITPLRSLTSLERLSLGNNNISDITPLKSLKTLGEVYISDNKVNEDQLKDLKRALPDCYIDSI